MVLAEVNLLSQSGCVLLVVVKHLYYLILSQYLTLCTEPTEMHIYYKEPYGAMHSNVYHALYMYRETIVIVKCYINIHS